MLRLEAARTADAKQARRILAIALVLDEHPRLLAAQAGGMDRQTLREWVHRYNADGLAALGERRSPPLSANSKSIDEVTRQHYARLYARRAPCILRSISRPEERAHSTVTAQAGLLSSR
jgi:transposase